MTSKKELHNQGSEIKLCNCFQLATVETLIITGAGFSYDAGLPLEKDAIPLGFELCKKNKPELIKGIEDYAVKTLGINNIFELSIEEILTKSTIEELFSYPKKDYIKEILPLELGILELFCKALKIDILDKLPDHYYSFVDLYKENTAFVTFNNDFLLEKIFQQRKYYWNYLETGKVENRLGYKDFYYKLSQASYFDPKPNVIPYLKLHGSFNWHYCWRCWNVRITGEKYFGVSGEPFSMSDRFTHCCTECLKTNGWQAVMRPLIIPPTFIKYYGLKFIRNLWFTFNELVRKVNKIIIIGSSLRDEDVLFINTLSYLNKKNPELKEIICINPDVRVVTKLGDITNIRVKHYPYIKNYLESITDVSPNL